MGIAKTTQTTTSRRDTTFQPCPRQVLRSRSYVVRRQRPWRLGYLRLGPTLSEDRRDPGLPVAAVRRLPPVVQRWGPRGKRLTAGKGEGSVHWSKGAASAVSQGAA
eukprot:scaffold2930_cov244-Pinguiococcus_pyrenoidosus.AAC.6